MTRPLSVRNIVDKKYRTFPLEGVWADFIGRPERSGIWFIWGNSGNGKTSFVLQLCKELCKYDRVLFDSLEEGTSLTLKNNLVKYDMLKVGRKIHFVNEDMTTLSARLRRNKSYNIIVIDSFQYTGMSYEEYKKLKQAFPGKLFIFLSHAEGKNPRGNAAVSVMYDATLKIWVAGYKAVSNGRFIGRTGEYVIWDKMAEKYGKNDGIR